MSVQKCSLQQGQTGRSQFSSSSVDGLLYTSTWLGPRRHTISALFVIVCSVHFLVDGIQVLEFFTSIDMW